MNVPVVGGHGGDSILAFVSQTDPPVDMSDTDMQQLEKRITNAAFEVVNAKNGAGSATLSMAYAAARFTKSLINSVIKADGERDFAYVSTAGLGSIPGLTAEDTYFAGHCDFGKDGVKSMDALPVASLRPFEKVRLEEARRKCQEDVAKAVDYVRRSS